MESYMAQGPAATAWKTGKGLEPVAFPAYNLLALRANCARALRAPDRHPLRTNEERQDT
jgi:hypothetical protein